MDGLVRKGDAPVNLASVSKYPVGRSLVLGIPDQLVFRSNLLEPTPAIKKSQPMYLPVL
jgi:hypothetical protein